MPKDLIWTYLIPLPNSQGIAAVKRAFDNYP